jgi:hypothetical protein
MDSNSSTSHGLRTLDEEEVRYLTALTAEHAAGSFNNDPAYYNFHPIIFGLDERLKHPGDDEKKAFYKAYFDGESYRPDDDLHGLVRNGYLDIQHYSDAREARLKPPPTGRERLMRRIVDRDHTCLTDDEAAGWLAETARVFKDEEDCLSPDQVNTLYSAAVVVAEICGVDVGQDLLDLSERALISAARRGEASSLSDPRLPVDGRLAAPIVQAYREALEATKLQNFKVRALDAILSRDVVRCRDAIRADLPDTAEQFLDSSLLQELHGILAKDRRFYFEILSIVKYFAVEHHVLPAKDRLIAYVTAVLNGTVSQFLGSQSDYPTLDKSATFQLRALLRLLGREYSEASVTRGDPLSAPSPNDAVTSCS